MAEPARRGRDLRAYRRAVARLKRTVPPICAYPECGKPIDLTLDSRHPMSFTADHPEALAAGGHILQALQPMHRSCNAKKGDGRRRQPPPTPTSRDW